MAGHLRQRGPNRWQLIVSNGFDPAGRRQVVRRTFHGSRKEAGHALAALVLEVGRTSQRARSDATVDQVVGDYLETTSLSPTTRADFERIRRKLPARLAATPIWKVEGRDLDAAYRWAEREGWSAHRVQRMHTVLSAALGCAVRRRWITRNPAEDARPPSPRRPLTRAPSADEVRRLIDAADPAFGLFLRLAFLTGLRRGELLALRWGDVTGPSIRCVHAVVYTPAVGVVAKSPKSDRGRVVSVDPETRCRLATHREAMAGYLLRELDDATYVFTSDPAGLAPWRPDFVTWKFRRLRDAVGVKCRLHDLRHGTATHGLRGGYDVATVAARLGHARPSITTDVYGHASTSQDEALADHLAGLIDGP